MQKKTLFQLLQVALGILMGVLVTLSVVRYRERQHLYNTRYGEWRKLNLILDLVEKNYVDTLNRESMTNAAVEAALAKLYYLFSKDETPEKVKALMEANLRGERS